MKSLIVNIDYLTILVKVTYYDAGTPSRISGTFGDSEEGSPPEVEFEVFDIDENENPFLDYLYREVDEFYEKLKSKVLEELAK